MSIDKQLDAIRETLQTQISEKVAVEVEAKLTEMGQEGSVELAAEVVALKEQLKAITEAKEEVVVDSAESFMKELHSQLISGNTGVWSREGFQVSEVSSTGVGDGAKIAYNPIIQNVRQLPSIVNHLNVRTVSEGQENYRLFEGANTYQRGKRASGSAISGNSATIAQWNVSHSPFRVEFEEDTRKFMNIAELRSLLEQNVGVDLVNGLATQVVSGDGTGANLKGLETYTTAAAAAPALSGDHTIKAVTGVTYTFDNLIDYRRSLGIQYLALPGNAWFLNEAKVDEIRTIKDTNGRPVFLDFYNGMNAQVSDMAVGTLFGYTVYCVPQLTKGIFGNLSAGVDYNIRDSFSMNVYEQTNPGYLTFYGEGQDSLVIKDPRRFVMLED